MGIHLQFKKQTTQHEFSIRRIRQTLHHLERISQEEESQGYGSPQD